MLAAIDRFDREIATVAGTLPDYTLFQGLPGAGLQLAPRLLAAFGEQRERFHGADELQKYSGIAPVVNGGQEARSNGGGRLPYWIETHFLPARESRREAN